MHGMRYGFGFYAVSLLLSLMPALGYARDTPLPAACTTHCKVVFGKVLGVGAGNVPAYSNCNANCVNRVPVIKNGTYTGIKWQCVEYARRWLLQNKGVVYGDVNLAADIWGLKYVTRVRDKTRLKMINYPNGSRIRPVAGDLLVYARAYLKTGHVAVISEVNAKQRRIHVLEQNYKNTKWPGDYARSIPYIKRHQHYWILDAYVLGWKHISKQHYSTGSK
ncbi:MAG: CHAP domain-containing protein [Gammaproteobacteria bacterium]|jgi:hypothetical protein